MTIGVSADYMLPSHLTEIKIYGESAPGLLLAPFSIPIYLEITLKKKQILPEIFDTSLFRLSSLILFNWALYGIVIYFLLNWFKQFKRSNDSTFSSPPSPPEFD